MQGEGEGEEEDAEQEEELDFQADPQFADMPPLDKMRKVRREILRTINDIRAKFNNAALHQDPLTNAVANEYAEYLLQNDDAVN